MDRHLLVPVCVLAGTAALPKELCATEDALVPECFSHVYTHRAMCLFSLHVTFVCLYHVVHTPSLHTCTSQLHAQHTLSVCDPCARDLLLCGHYCCTMKMAPWYKSVYTVKHCYVLRVPFQWLPLQ